MLATVLAQPSHHEGLDDFLFTYITKRGTFPTADVHDHTESAIADLTRTTIASLVAAGANINSRQAPSGPTALHALIWSYARGEHQLLGRLTLGSTILTTRLTRERAWYLRFLVEQCGADPFSQWQGKTPTETLALGWKNLREEERAIADEILEVSVSGGDGLGSLP